MASSDSAPGALDDIRRLLNTWTKGMDNRASRDDLADIARSTLSWRETFDVLEFPQDGIEPVGELRTVLRLALDASPPTELNRLLSSNPLRPKIVDDSDSPVRMVPELPGTVGEALAIVLDAIAAERWPRLKACPECLYVFYDTTRNRSRTWCAMTPARPGDRGCGAVAKSRAHRRRQREGKLSEIDSARDPLAAS